MKKSRLSSVPHLDVFGRYLALDVKEENNRRAYTRKHLNKRYGRPAKFGAQGETLTEK